MTPPQGGFFCAYLEANMQSHDATTTTKYDANDRLRVGPAAEYVGLKPQTLNKYRMMGGGPVFYRVGRLISYRVGDLDAWLLAQRRNSTSEYRKQA
jgi:hypothetical protein